MRQDVGAGVDGGKIIKCPQALNSAEFMHNLERLECLRRTLVATNMKLRLGLTPWHMNFENGVGSLCEQAVQAESWGYESMFLPEHHFSSQGAIPEPLMLLASVAAVTTTLRLGTTSYLLPLRHPVMAAEQVAVLDQISNGRVTLGIGRGYAAGMFDVFDVDPKEKRRIFAYNLDLMLRAWQGEPLLTDSSGHNFQISPLPVQKPHPPIYVAAFGPLALKQAGNLGFPYLASPMETKSRLRENYHKHRAACENADTGVPAVTPLMRSAFISNDAREIRRMKERLDKEMQQAVRNSETNTPITADDWAIVGSPSFLEEAVNEYQSELGMTEIVVTRLRIGGVPTEMLAQSMELVAKSLR